MMGRWLVLACGVAFAHGALHEQIESLGKSIALTPRNPALYVKRGELHRMHQEWMAAASDFNQALAIDGKTADAVLGLARLASDRGELARAGFQAALAAWEQLPERLRQTKAMGELRARIAAGL